MSTTKQCRACAGSFTPSAHQLSKSDWICRDCDSARHREWEARRKAEGRPVQHTRMPREYHQAYEAVYTRRPEVKQRRAAQMRGYATAHGTAEHHKARRKVRTEIEAGRMHRKACEVCGELKTHAHHDDYSKPLDVRWLCPKHHREHHAKATGSAA